MTTTRTKLRYSGKDQSVQMRAVHHRQSLKTLLHISKLMDKIRISNQKICLTMMMTEIRPTGINLREEWRRKNSQSTRTELHHLIRSKSLRLLQKERYRG